MGLWHAIFQLQRAGLLTCGITRSYAFPGTTPVA